MRGFFIFARQETMSYFSGKIAETKPEHDQYYTSPAYARHCYEITQRYAKPLSKYFEPCNGYGAFGSLMPPHRSVKIDLYPVTSDTIPADFMEFNIDLRGFTVVSNPPFGRRNNLSLGFLNRCADLGADLIAMVLPRSFRKSSIQNKVNTLCHLVYEEVTPDDVFIVNGKPYDVRCVFQIWKRGDHQRELTVLPTECEWCSFDNSPTNYSLIVCGKRAGKIKPYSHDDCRGFAIPIHIKTHAVGWFIATASKIDRPCIYDTASIEGMSPGEFIREFSKVVASKVSEQLYSHDKIKQGKSNMKTEVKYLIVTSRNAQAETLQDLIEGDHQSPAVTITPELLNVLKGAHQYIDGGSLSGCLYYLNGDLLAFSGAETEPDQYSQDFYQTAISSVVTHLDPSMLSFALNSLLKLENGFKEVKRAPVQRQKRSTTSQGEVMGSEALKGAVMASLEAGLVPVVSDGKRELLEIERDIASPEMSEGQRNKLRKELKDVLTIPRFKTVQKWQKDINEQGKSHDYQDWLSGAKDEVEGK